MRYFIIPVVFGLCVLAFIKPINAQPAQGESPPSMPVSIEVIAPKKVQIWSEFSGRISAVDYVEIRPQVSGKIQEILFQNGAHVEKGAVLFVIDPRPYEAAFKQADAALNSAKTAYNLANKEVVRAKELIKTNAISQRIYDERVSASLVAKAHVEEAQAAVDYAQINLDYTKVIAPISGQVSRAEITLGNLVDANAAPILTSIVSNDGVYADFDVDEKTYVKALKEGRIQGGELEKTLVKLTIPSVPDAEFEGVLQSFDNRINPSSGTIRARAFFPNKERILVPGMFVSVKMGSPSHEEKIMISESHIGTDQNRKFVLVVDEGIASYRPVTLGESSGGERVITSGLNAGDELITEGLMKVYPGTPVVAKGQDYKEGAMPEGNMPQGH